MGLSAGNPLQEHIVRQAARLGHHLAFRVRLATLDAVCRLVSRGIGIAVVPEVAARRPGLASRLHIVPLKDEWATRHSVLSGRADSPVCRRMASSLQEHLRRMMLHQSGRLTLEYPTATSRHSSLQIIERSVPDNADPIWSERGLQVPDSFVPLARCHRYPLFVPHASRARLSPRSRASRHA